MTHGSVKVSSSKHLTVESSISWMRFQCVFSYIYSDFLFLLFLFGRADLLVHMFLYSCACFIS